METTQDSFCLACFAARQHTHARVGVGAAGGACDKRVQAGAGTRGHRAHVPSLAHRSPCLVRTCSQLGDSFVGKSSIVLRFVKGQFNEQQVTTVGAAFLQTELQLSQQDGGKRITFGIWDTAGSERYKSLAPMYYRGAEAAVVVYDITKFDTFEGAKSWVRELKLYGQPNVVVALAANKFDHEDAREVSTHEGQAYARENDLLYFETSAKTNHNLQEMFAELGAPATTRARPWDGGGGIGAGHSCGRVGSSRCCQRPERSDLRCRIDAATLSAACVPKGTERPLPTLTVLSLCSRAPQPSSQLKACPVRMRTPSLLPPT